MSTALYIGYAIPDANNVDGRCLQLYTPLSLNSFIETEKVSLHCDFHQPIND